MGQGFYLGGGLGYLRKDDKYTKPAGPFKPGEFSSLRKERLYMALGLGAAINRHWSVFGRVQGFFDNDLNYAEAVDRVGSSYDFSAQVTCGVEFHF